MVRKYESGLHKFISFMLINAWIKNCRNIFKRIS